MNTETDTKERITTEIATVQTALTEFDKISAGLVELTTKYDKAVFPVATAAGMVMAKQARQEIRAPRYATEQARVKAKREILGIGKSIDERARYIEQALTALEDPIHAQIAAEEKRKEDERAARQKAEQERLARIQAAIGELKDYVTAAINQDISTIGQIKHDLSKVQISKEVFFEFVDIAEAAKVAAVNKLTEMLGEATQRKADADKLKAEQEELARRQAEQLERERAEAARLAQEAAQRDADYRARLEALAAEEAAAKARIEAAERQAAADREAAEATSRKIQQEERDRHQAEYDKRQQELQAEADRLAKERQAKEERDRKAQAEKDAKAKAKADREEAARQKALRKEMERSDARQLLSNFAGRYADVSEFHEILVAIDVYFQEHPEKVAA